MSAAAKNIALVALGAAGAVFAVKAIAKPTASQGIAGAVRKQLDNYNDTVHPEQDRRYAGTRWHVRCDEFDVV